VNQSEDAFLVGCDPDFIISIILSLRPSNDSIVLSVKKIN